MASCWIWHYIKSSKASNWIGDHITRCIIFFFLDIQMQALSDSESIVFMISVYLYNMSSRGANLRLFCYPGNLSGGIPPTRGFGVCREYFCQFYIYLTSWIHIWMMQVRTCWAFWDRGEKVHFLVKKNVFSMFQSFSIFSLSMHMIITF